MGRPKKDSPMKGKKRKMNKDPNKPKRPTSAYFYYAEFCRAELKSQGKKITKVGDFTKEVSKKWGALTESAKKPYAEKAAKDRARYDTQMAAYKGKDVNKPKRPQSSYFCFLADFRIQMKDSKLDHKAILTKAGERWKSLSPAEKKPYEEAAEKEKAAYLKRMDEYNKGGGAAAAAKKAKMDAAALNGNDDSEEEEDDDEEDDDDDEYEDDDE